MEDPDKSSPKVWQSLVPAVLQKKKIKEGKLAHPTQNWQSFHARNYSKNGIKQTTDFLNIKTDNS